MLKVLIHNGLAPTQAVREAAKGSTRAAREAAKGFTQAAREAAPESPHLRRSPRSAAP